MTGRDVKALILETLRDPQAAARRIIAVDLPPQAGWLGLALVSVLAYALMALVGIAPEDDDGNAAVKAVNREPATVARISPTAGVWEATPPEQQAFLQKIADSVLDLMPDSAAAHDYIASQQLDTEEKAALWTRLDSKTRTALKKAHQEAA